MLNSKLIKLYLMNFYNFINYEKLLTDMINLVCIAQCFRLPAIPR